MWAHLRSNPFTTPAFLCPTCSLPICAAQEPGVTVLANPQTTKKSHHCHQGTPLTPHPPQLWGNTGRGFKTLCCTATLLGSSLKRFIVEWGGREWHAGGGWRQQRFLENGEWRQIQH